MRVPLRRVLIAAPFPRNFMACLKVIYTRLFRIFAIVYSHHFTKLEELGAVSHLNTSFKHFMLFVWEFDLVQPAEMDALREIVDELRSRYPTAGASKSRKWLNILCFSTSKYVGGSLILFNIKIYSSDRVVAAFNQWCAMKKQQQAKGDDGWEEADKVLVMRLVSCRVVSVRLFDKRKL